MRTSPDLDIAMDRVEEVYPSTNNSLSQPIESSHVQHNIRFQDHRVSPPKEFALFLCKHLPKNMTKCKRRCGKSIDKEDGMVIRSYGTSNWKVTGKENFKYGPMYLHFNEKSLKKVYDENYYGPRQAFNYSAVRANPKSKGDINPADIHLLTKLGISYILMFDFCFICFYLTLVKLFFLSGKRPFYDTYLTYIVCNDFFDHSSLCFLFSFLSMFLQSCISSPKYSNKPTSSFNFCFLFIWIKVIFSLSTFKIQRR